MSIIITTISAINAAAIQVEFIKFLLSGTEWLFDSESIGRNVKDRLPAMTAIK